MSVYAYKLAGWKRFDIHYMDPYIQLRGGPVLNKGSVKAEADVSENAYQLALTLSVVEPSFLVPPSPHV